jgi:hypothetical protein
VCPAAGWQRRADEATIRLFNGKDLSGWRAVLVDPAVKMEQVWSVRDGVLVCKGEPLGYLHTDRDFTSYRLVVEWRWAPGTTVTPTGAEQRRPDADQREPKGIPRSSRRSCDRATPATSTASGA